MPTAETLAAYFERERPDRVVLEVSKRIVREPRTATIYGYVREHAQLVATIEGEAPRWAGLSPLEYQGVRELATRILVASAFGPRLEVYRWR